MKRPTQQRRTNNNAGLRPDLNVKQELDHMLASEEARRSLRKAARVGAAGVPMEIDEPTRRSLSPIALKACGRLAAVWRLRPAELASLLAMTPSEYDAVREHPDQVLLNPEQFDRAGLLIEIFVTLYELFIGNLAFEWPSRPNKGELFGGLSAVELMQRGGVTSMRNVLGHLQAMAMGL